MNKGSVILVTLFSIWAYSCSGHKKEPGCAKLKTGRFLLKKNAWHDEMNITRNNSVQIGNETTTGDISYWKVVWTGDCSFELTFINKVRTNGVRDSLVGNEAIPVLRETILEANDKYYIFETTFGQGTFSYKDTMWVNGKVGGFRSIGDVYKNK